MDYIIASHNLKKRDEISRILNPLGIRVLLAEEAGVELTDAEETGKTFEENAFIKADLGCKESGMPCIADDSGLAVDALGGAPGVHSARFAPVGRRKEKVLALMKDKTDRKATFVCCAVCVFPDGREFWAEGRLEGEIGFERRGENGFGYDPIFMLPDRGLTLAELPEDEKNAISHRRKAFTKLGMILKGEQNDR